MYNANIVLTIFGKTNGNSLTLKPVKTRRAQKRLVTNGLSDTLSDTGQRFDLVAHSGKNVFECRY